MKEEFVPYEQALALKDLGFDEPCFATIDQTEFVHIKGTKYPIRGAMCYDTIDVPTFSQAFRWFREKYNLQNGIAPYYDYYYYLIKDCTADKEYQNDYDQNSYEEAELACLDKLIEIVKNTQ